MKGNGYSTKTIQNAVNHKPRSLLNPTEIPKFVSIPYVPGTSDKIGKILSKFNFKVAYKSRNTLKSILSHTKPRSDDNKNCIYSIPCQCGQQYIGETKRPLAVRVNEHQKKVKQGETTSSKLAEHSWDNEHHFNWVEAKPLMFEDNTFKRKFKEAAMIHATKEPVSQPSIEIQPVWKPLLKQNINSSAVAAGCNPPNILKTPHHMSPTPNSNPNPSSLSSNNINSSLSPAFTDNQVSLTPNDTPNHHAPHHYQTRYKNRKKT